MLAIAFATGAYNRSALGMAPMRLVNRYCEDTPTGSARFPRPGLVETYDLGSGPIRGLFVAAGAFGGDLFVVSGTTVYRAGVSAGTVTGSDKVRFAASSTELVIVAAGEAYLYNGTTLALIDDTDLPPVSDVAFLAGRFIYAGVNTDRFYWSATSNAGSIDGLAFATAEGSSDIIVGLAVVAGQLVIFGTTSTEFWNVTGDNDLPFQRSGEAAYPRGCAAQDAIVVTDNSVLWVGDDRIIYRGGNVPARISNHGVEAALKTCTSIDEMTAFEVRIEGHAFVVFNIPGVTTFALDLAAPNTSDGWAEWSSYGRDTFRGETSVLTGGAVLIGDGTTGQVFTATTDAYADDGETITYLVSAYVAHADKAVRCDNVVVQGARGVGLTTGQGSAPLTELRYSDDGGKTWSDWRSASLGAIGNYSTRAVWQRLGLIREPGRLFEVRTTDPVLATVTGLLVNQARPHG